MTRKAALTRRNFLKTATAAAVAGPYAITSAALGAGDKPPASGRIVTGSIGMGGRGTGDMRAFLGRSDCQVVAVCDVDRSRRYRARDMVNKQYQNQDCADYIDFRELLDRKDLNAVTIGTPDHWHAILVIRAAKRGLDMFCQKPLSLTIAEGRAMSDACKRYNVVFQTGSQQRSGRNFRYACELVRNGRIGRLHTMEVGLPTGKTIEPQPEMPVPDGFDYNMWLGQAPWAPYTEKRCHYQFRWILDYSGGQLTDWGAHHCDIAQWGAGTSYTGPTEIEGKGEFPRDGLYTAAVNYKFTCTYAQGFKMIVADGKTYPNGIRFVGTRGWIFISRRTLDAEPKNLLTSVIGPNEMHLYESPSHTGNFIDCIYSRGETVAPIENAHRSVAIAHLGNIAMQLERKVRWNPDTERFVDDPEADRMLRRPMRSPWHL